MLRFFRSSGAMQRLGIVAAALALVAGRGLVAPAALETVVECRKAYRATPEFRFKRVPPPSAGNAATKAEFSIVAGEADPHCGGLACLNDGKLPRQGDAPAANFFFNAGTPGGRLAVDLAARSPSSRSTPTRGTTAREGPKSTNFMPALGSEAGFNRRPKAGSDPQACGWKLLAAVDTRAPRGQCNGQYGVSITDSEGIVGKYRYLLFDISRTESKDPFGNTFYSEIEVIDAAAPPRPLRRRIRRSKKPLSMRSQSTAPRCPN